MTEQEWLSKTAFAMWTWLSLTSKRSDRKARLLGAPCARRAGRLLTDACLWDWITSSERCAEGTAAPEELERARADANAYRHKKLHEDFFFRYVEGDLHGAPAPDEEVERYRASHASDPAGTAREIARAFATVLALATVQHRHCSAAHVCFDLSDPRIEAEIRGHASDEDLIRDVFGNPFRPVTIDPAWRTPTVLALAEAAYDERILPEGRLAADRLAVLADALEEAGCIRADLSNHLRVSGPHVRGCWVVDQILAKE
jgi:hypothetical protein